MVVPRPFGNVATDLGDQISDREPTVGMGSTVAVVFDGDGLSRLDWCPHRRWPHPSIHDSDRLRGGPEPLPRRGPSRSRRRSGKTHVIGIRAVSGCIGASVAVTHVLPASESSEVSRVRGGASGRRWRCGATYPRRIVVVAAVPRWSQLGSATGAWCNKIHMVLRQPRKRDLGTASDGPASAAGVHDVGPGRDRAIVAIRQPAVRQRHPRR